MVSDSPIRYPAHLYDRHTAALIHVYLECFLEVRFEGNVELFLDSDLEVNMDAQDGLKNYLKYPSNHLEYPSNHFEYPSNHLESPSNPLWSLKPKM